MTAINIPKTVKLIGKFAFFGCSSSESLVLSTNPEFTTVSESAFEGCSSIKIINIPTNIVHIEKRAFFNCSQATELNFININEESNHSLCETIGESAFENCVKIAYINIPNTVVANGLGKRAFYNACSDSSINNTAIAGYATGALTIGNQIETIFEFLRGVSLTSARKMGTL